MKTAIKTEFICVKLKLNAPLCDCEYPVVDVAEQLMDALNV